MMRNSFLPFFVLGVQILAFFVGGLYLLAYPLWVVPYLVAHQMADALLFSEAVLTGSLGVGFVGLSLFKVYILYGRLSDEAN